MKKYLLTSIIVMLGLGVSAQVAQLQKSNFVIDVNTTVSSFAGTGIGIGGGTSLLFIAVDGSSIWNVGGEAGYFVVDRLAIKLGIGVGGDFYDAPYFSFKLGAKYYLIDRIPIQLDYYRQSGSSFYSDEASDFIGIQAGYALFFGDMVSLEPTLRYNISVFDSYSNIFQLQIGFSIFL